MKKEMDVFYDLYMHHAEYNAFTEMVIGDKITIYTDGVIAKRVPVHRGRLVCITNCNWVLECHATPGCESYMILHVKPGAVVEELNIPKVEFKQELEFSTSGRTFEYEADSYDAEARYNTRYMPESAEYDYEDWLKKYRAHV